MAKTLKRPTNITKASLAQHVKRYLDSKTLADEAASRVRQQRDGLIAYAEKHGVLDANGHQWLEIDDIGKVKRERRTSVQIDEEYTEDWLKANKMWDRCTSTITVIDEDALYSAIYEGDIPEDVADAMFTQKETFALKVEEYK